MEGGDGIFCLLVNCAFHSVLLFNTTVCNCALKTYATLLTYTTTGKRTLYVSDEEYIYSDEEFYPSTAKKRKSADSRPARDHTPASRSHTPSQNVAPNQQLKGDFLAKILTDIPEIDICPLASLSVAPPTSQMTTPISQATTAVDKR